MPTLLELIAEREAAASATAEQLRERIAQLTDQLAAAETELAELAITRKTLTTLTGRVDNDQASGQASQQAGEEAGTAALLDATIASPAYQSILAVFATATSALRAKDICLALGLDTTPKHTEGTRAKLKRLVARAILTETEPGLFTLAPVTPSA